MWIWERRETQYIDQAGLEIKKIYLPLFPKCWDLKHEPPLPSVYFGVFFLQNMKLNLSTVFGGDTNFGR